LKVFLTGATGFVGHEIVRQLLKEGHALRCLVRPGSEKKLPHREKIEIHHGDATQPETLAGGLAGCDAVVHLVGIIREFPQKGITFRRLHVEATANVVEAAKRAGVTRYIQMSANGVREKAATDYHRTKYSAEEIVKGSGLDWTIFRPSVVFGRGGEFLGTLADLVRRFPVVPVIGNGAYRMEPVSVKDVAEAFVASLGRKETIGRTYPCCGPKSYSYDELLDTIGDCLGKKKVTKIHHPLSFVKPMVKLMESSPSFPITSCQLEMLLEGNVCSSREWVELLRNEPLSFEEGLVDALKR